MGVLYLIDSVVRKWVDLAKQQHQEIASTAQDGTYGAGVFRVTEILPALMDNILQTAPADQKVRGAHDRMCGLVAVRRTVSLKTFGPLVLVLCRLAAIPCCADLGIAAHTNDAYILTARLPLCRIGSRSWWTSGRGRRRSRPNISKNSGSSSKRPQPVRIIRESQHTAKHRQGD